MARPPQEVLEELRMVSNPGEYGNGTEEGSISTISPPDLSEATYPEIEEYLDQEKKAWERVGELLDELGETVDNEYGMVRYYVVVDVLEETVDNENQTASKRDIQEEVFREVHRQYERGDDLRVEEVCRWKVR